MIVIAGTVKIQPEARAAAAQAAAEMARATRAEAGCNAYCFAVDVEDPDTICIFEQWEGDEALARHFTTPHMAVFQKQLAGVLAGPPVITRYVVASSGPL